MPCQNRHQGSIHIVTGSGKLDQTSKAGNMRQLETIKDNKIENMEKNNNKTHILLRILAVNV